MHVDGACITHAFTDAVTPPADLAVGRLIYFSLFQTASFIKEESAPLPLCLLGLPYATAWTL